jgi:cell division protein FtsW (lipid II flippase)
MYQEVDFGTETFLRDFRTIPLWLIPVLILSVLSLITPSFKVSKKIVILNIIVLPVAVLFTFTRSIVFIILIQVVFLFFLYISKLNKRFLSRIILFLAFLSVSFIVIQKQFPAQSAYFQERLLSAKREGRDEENLNVRFTYFTEANKIVRENNAFMGTGMDRSYYPRMNALGAWIADSTIPYFLIHTGWIGVVWIFGIVFVFFSDSFLFFLKTGDWLAGYLCTSFLAVFISSLIMGGEVLTGSVWILVNFALYSVIKFNSWKPAKRLVSVNENEPGQALLHSSNK